MSLVNKLIRHFDAIKPFISVVRYKAWLVTYNMQVGQVRGEMIVDVDDDG